tara:strand:+ start:2485 stop:3579 length:1095 start_codon:yes stop_codon:yes gene_type:complete
MEKVSVIGVGKLGLCFSLSLERVGYDVLGVDVNEDYVNTLNDKSFLSSEPNVSKYLQNSTNFLATTSLQEALKFSDNLFVFVATPSLPDGSYDHSQIERVVDQLPQLSSSRKNLIIGCTTMPGYCKELQERIQERGYNLVYNPEFIAQGSIIKDQESPDMVLIGESSKGAASFLEGMYKRFTRNNPAIFRLSLTSAEICKLALNCFVTTKIAYTNMVGDIISSAGEDPQPVLDAIASDSRVGNKCMKYGFGYGGPCFPRDNRALAIYADSMECPAEVSKATDVSNQSHLKFMIDSFKGDSATVNGLTYKKGSNLIEESQQLAYAVGLARKGVKVTVVDNPTVIEEVMKLYGDLFNYNEQEENNS